MNWTDFVLVNSNGFFSLDVHNHQKQIILNCEKVPKIYDNDLSNKVTSIYSIRGLRFMNLISRISFNKGMTVWRSWKYKSLYVVEQSLSWRFH